MTKIMQFDRTNILSFKDAVEKRLEEIGDEFGISIKLNTSNVSSRTSVNMTMTATVGDDVELKDTPSGRLFCAYGRQYGLTPEMLGQTITIRGTIYKVTGWSASSRKYVVEVERVRDGAVVRVTADEVRKQLGMKSTAPQPNKMVSQFKPSWQS